VPFRHSVPGSLRGLLFARIVPLTEGNVESGFAQCGLVPVAVPHTERPAPPSVRVTVADDGSVAVDVESAGEVRIRRARAMTAEPRYVPVVATVRGQWNRQPARELSAGHLLGRDPARPGTRAATGSAADPEPGQHPDGRAHG
jgi:hypothetical protein